MYYLIDTCFWIALYNPLKDPRKTEEAEIISELIENENIIVPFPTLYEFLNSRFSRRDFVYNFEKLLARPNFKKIYDKEYRDKAFDNFFYNTKNLDSDVSLVDEIIKEMIEDNNLKIDYLVTFDKALKNFATSRGVNVI